MFKAIQFIGVSIMIQGLYGMYKHADYENIGNIISLSIATITFVFVCGYLIYFIKHKGG